MSIQAENVKCMLCYNGATVDESAADLSLLCFAFLGHLKVFAPEKQMIYYHLV